MSPSDDLGILRQLPKIRRQTFAQGGSLRELFTKGAARSDIHDAITRLFHSVLTTILDITPSLKIDYGYLRLWTASFAEPFETAFRISLPAVDIKKNLDNMLSLAGPRFPRERDLHLEAFEVIFERLPHEYISDDDLESGRFPTNLCSDSIFLFPFAFRSHNEAGFQFDSGEAIVDFFKRPYISYAFNLFAHDYFSQLPGGDYGYWVAAFTGLLRAERILRSAPASYLVVPVADVGHNLGCCCIAFSTRCDVIQKTALSSLTEDLVRSVVTSEAVALDSRAHSIYSATTSMLCFAHEFSGLLHRQALAIAALKSAATRDSSSEQLLSAFSSLEQTSNELMKRAKAIASDLRSPSRNSTWTTIVNLATAIHQSIAHGYQDRVLIGYSAVTDSFLLTGLPNDLAETLLPFINNAFEEELRNPSSTRKKIRDSKHYKDIFEPWLVGSPGDECVVYITIWLIGGLSGNQSIKVYISIRDSGKGLPQETIEALGASSFWGRLPSSRLAGGAGILTSIAAIQTKYAGECVYEHNNWSIQIPVQLSAPKDWLTIDAENQAEIVERATTLKKDPAKALIDKASRLGKVGRVEEEVATYDEVVRRFGDSAEPMSQIQVARALVNKGNRLGELGHYEEEELAACDEVVRRFGDSTEPALAEQVAEALLNKGDLLLRLNRPDDGIAVYDELVKRFDQLGQWPFRLKVAEALVRKGNIVASLNWDEKAIAIYDEVTRKFGDATESALCEQLALALINQGFVLGRLNRHDEAIATFEKVVRRFGESEELFLRENVAQALMRKGLMLESLDHKETAISVYDEVLGHFAAAKDQSIRLAVGNALINKARILQTQGRWEDTMVPLGIAIIRFGDVFDPKLYKSTVRFLAAGLNLKRLMLEQLEPSEDAIAEYDDLLRQFGDAKEPRLQIILGTAALRQAAMCKDLNQQAKASCLCNNIIQRFANHTDDPEVKAIVDRAVELIQSLGG